jgi:dihydroorotate dehydrogenase (fumarate)
MALSTSSELRLPLRHIALLYGRVSADLACSTGIHRGEDVVKALLAGSTITQVAGALIKNGIHHLATLIRDLEAWMDERGYDTIDDFRGTVSQQSVSDPFAFERAQYVTLLAEGKGHAPLNARVN